MLSNELIKHITNTFNRMNGEEWIESNFEDFFYKIKEFYTYYEIFIDFRGHRLVTFRIKFPEEIQFIRKYEI